MRASVGAMRLALTRCDISDSDSSHRVDPLGPWCLSPEEQHARWSSGHWSRAFDDRAHDAAAVTAALAEWLLGTWQLRLNSLHGRTYSRRFWGIVLRAWLITLADLSFDKYVRLIARLREPRHIVVWPRNAGFTIDDTRAFLLGSEQEPLTRFIASRIVCALSPDCWTIEEGSALPVPPKPPAILRKERVLRMRHWATLLGANLGRVQLLDVYGISDLHAAALSVRTVGRPTLSAPVHADRDSDSVESARQATLERFERCGFGDRAAGELFLETIDSLSRDLLPVNVSAGFLANERKARAKARFTAPWIDTVVCGPVLGGNDEAKFYLGWLADRRGVRIVVNQHGGNYGLLETYSFVTQTDYRASDRFLSWGWREQTGCLADAVPASSPMLSRLTPAHVPDGPIILVTTNVPSYNARIDAALFADDAPSYREMQLQFGDALGAELLSNLRVRLYGRTASADEMYWRARHPGVEFVRGPLPPALASSRLVVVDHPGTTMLLTMAAEIPTVLFWDSRVWKMGAAARPALAALRACAVLHESPASAAAHIQSIGTRVMDWWNEEATRSARDRFVQSYARKNADWMSEWTQMLRNPRAEMYQPSRVSSGMVP